MRQVQIRRLFGSVVVRVSAGYLAGLLIDTDEFAPQAQAIGEAGIAGAGYAHIDVTPRRVAGVEESCHVLGNTAFVFYHTDLFRVCSAEHTWPKTLPAENQPS